MVGELFGCENILELWDYEKIIWPRQLNKKKFLEGLKVFMLFIPGRFQTEADWPFMTSIIKGLNGFWESGRLRTTFIGSFQLESSVNYWGPNKVKLSLENTWSERIWTIWIIRGDSQGHLENQVSTLSLWPYLAVSAATSVHLLLYSVLCHPH